MKKFNNIPNELITDTNGRKHWISPSISVDVLLVVGDKVLIIKRSGQMSFAGFWCLPCGFMDWGETPLYAAYRELYEETGVDVRELEIINADFARPYSLNGTALQFKFEVDMNYPNDYPKLDIDDEECTDARWVSIDELQDYEFAFGHDELIKKILS